MNIELEQAIARWTEGCNPQQIQVTHTNGLIIAVCRSLLEADLLCRKLHAGCFAGCPGERVEIRVWVPNHPGEWLHYDKVLIESKYS